MPAWGVEPATPAWKMELNAKLAAHRQRRPPPGAPGSQDGEQANAPRDGAPGGSASGPASPGSASPGSASRSASVAARVAERYAKAPSYSEFLAASAAAAAAAAETAAFAARQAHDAAETFARLAAEGEPRHGAEQASPGAEAGSRGIAFAEPPESRRPTVEHPEPLPARVVIPPRPAALSPGLFASLGGLSDPLAEATVPAAVNLPAKLIEFPRELIAARKARPRAAEGPLAEAPLFEQADPAALRIFEVEGEEGMAMAGEAGRDPREMSASAEPGASRAVSVRTGGLSGESLEREPFLEETSRQSARPESEHRDPPRSHSAARPAREQRSEGGPEWQSIRLGEHPSGEGRLGEAGAEQGEPLRSAYASAPAETPVLYPAPVSDRIMAALVDLSAVTAACLLVILIFASCTTHPPVNRTALICAAVIYGTLGLFYLWLFMSYGGGTLGMRYARIAICTFDDNNPTRRMMRRRVAASVLAALPLGLGLLWALFDEDSLGWHDRMSRTYQRSYR